VALGAVAALVAPPLYRRLRRRPVHNREKGIP
jgi:hypothetical protein